MQHQINISLQQNRSAFNSTLWLCTLQNSPPPLNGAKLPALCRLAYIVYLHACVETLLNPVFIHLQPEYNAADVIVMTLIRCVALLYSYHQFRTLSKMGSKYILGKCFARAATDAALHDVYMRLAPAVPPPRGMPLLRARCFLFYFMLWCFVNLHVALMEFCGCPCKMRIYQDLEHLDLWL